MADLNPSIQSVTGKEDDVRKAFKTKFAAAISSGAYDQRDLDRLDKEDGYVRCFLRTLAAKGDPSKAADCVDTAFKFRKEYGIWDLTESSFPAEVLDTKSTYYKGEDNKGHPILYMNTGANVAKTDEEREVVKKYIAYNFELHHRENPEVMCVVLMDMSSAGTANSSTDITKFIMSCFTTYFPSFLAYMINYDLPWVLSAFWKIISAFISKEQRNKIQMATKKDIAKYINDEHLWPHMKKGSK